MKKLLLLLLMALPLLGRSQTDSVLVLSDVHLDLTMRAFTFYHTDTDTVLFIDAVSQSYPKKFPFILMPGDFLAHGNGHDTSDMKKTFGYIIDNVQKIDTNAIILPALGNNDCVVHDTPDKPTYQVFYTSLLKRIDGDGSIFKTFTEGGYYSYNKGDLSVIVLNTLLFAFGPDQEADKEMAWFEKTLRDNAHAGKKVWIVYHIPPGIDRYGNQPLWHAATQKMYLAIIKKYAAAIKFQIGGHTHMNDCRLITDSGKIISYIDIAPGLDSRNGNNPAYQVIHYDTNNKTINKVNTYYTGSVNPFTWYSFSFQDFDFKFLLHYDDKNAEGLDYVKHYFTNRPQKKPANPNLYWSPAFCATSMIKTN